MHPSGDQRLGAFESSTWCPDHLHSALLVPKLVNMTKSLAWSNNSREGRFVLFYTWRGNDGPSWLGGCRGVRRLMTLYLCLRSSEHTRRWGYKLRLRAQQHTSPKETLPPEVSTAFQNPALADTQFTRSNFRAGPVCWHVAHLLFGYLWPQPHKILSAILHPCHALQGTAVKSWVCGVIGL